jgi:hypothetical protein
MTDGLSYKPRKVRRGDRRVSMRPYVNAPIIFPLSYGELSGSRFLLSHGEEIPSP